MDCNGIPRPMSRDELIADAIQYQLEAAGHAKTAREISEIAPALAIENQKDAARNNRRARILVFHLVEIRATERAILAAAISEAEAKERADVA